MPHPTRGDQSACSGGKVLTRTFQPVTAGTTIDATITTTAATRPRPAAVRTRSAAGDSVAVVMPTP